jgi:hypothetical protein
VYIDWNVGDQVTRESNMDSQKAIDHTLMRRVQQDDYEAFEELVGRYRARLVNLIYRMQ